MRAWLVIALITVASAPALHGNAAGSASERVLLLYGPDGPGLDLEERAAATFNLQSADGRLSPSVRHVSDALGDVAEIEVVGADEVLACPGAPVTAEVYTKELDLALEHILYVRIDEASQALERLRGMLPCIHDPLSGRDLAQISFLEGIGLSYAGEDDAAREAFRQALLVSPELDWEPRFPPGPELLFRQAIQAALRTPSAQLEVAAQVGDLATLWVDGVEFGPDGGTAPLAEGRHLVQWRTGAGGFGTRWLEVVSGTVIAVYSRDDVARAAVTGEGRSGSLDRARGALIRLAEQTGVDRIHLAEFSAVDLLHVFEPADGAWERTDAGVVARRVRARRQQDAGKGILVGGGALALAGGVVTLTGYVRARQLLGESEDIISPDMYAEKSDQYASARTQTNIGLAMTGAGLAAAAISIPLLKGNQGRTSDRQVQVADVVTSLHVTPGGIGLSGQF